LTRWQRARGLFPFTAGGLLVLVLCLLGVLVYGLGEIDLVLLVIGIVGLSLCGVGLLAVTSTALLVWLEVRAAKDCDPLELECGCPGRTGFSLSSLWFVPFVTLRWAWITPQVAVSQVRPWGRLVEQVTPLRRGEYGEILRRYEVGDAFGLVRIAFSVRERRALRFLPGTGKLRQIYVVHGMAGGDQFSDPEGPPMGDPLDLRRYVAGDPIRYVLWKVFARSRALVVRAPERALAPARQTVAYLVAGPGDEAAAGAARLAVDHGALGDDWVLGADGSSETARTRSQALDLIVRSAKVDVAGSGAGLMEFLRGGARGTVRRAIVFVPSVPGPWLARVTAAARARPDASSPLQFVVCADGVRPDPRRHLLARLLFRAPADEEVAYVPARGSEVGVVLRALGKSGGHVMLVDRRAGRVFSEAQLRRLEVAST
jgi:hypothetical protein